MKIKRYSLFEFRKSSNNLKGIVPTWFILLNGLLRMITLMQFTLDVDDYLMRRSARRRN